MGNFKRFFSGIIQTEEFFFIPTISITTYAKGEKTLNLSITVLAVKFLNFAFYVSNAKEEPIGL